MAGLVVVALGLRETRERFRKPTFTAHVRDWYKSLRLAVQRHPPITGHAVVSLGGTLRGKGVLSASLRSVAPQSLDERVTGIEEQVKCKALVRCPPWVIS